MQKTTTKQKGFGLLELLFALAISTLGVAVAITVNGSLVRAQKAADVSGSRLLAKDLLIAQISNLANWKASLKDPYNSSYVDCVFGSSGCDRLSPNLRVVSDDGKILYDENELSNGFKIGNRANGSVCYGFDAQSGNDDCPFHYNITWKIACPLVNGKCIQPVAQVTGKLNVKTQTNNEKLNFGNDTKGDFEIYLNLPDIGKLKIANQSVFVNKGSGPIDFDLLKQKSSIYLNSFGVKILSVATEPSRSTVSFSGSTYTYTPNPSFYGRDRLLFSVEENRFGQIFQSKVMIFVNVMTPFTWVGEGREKDIYDDLNWCGNVENGVCSHNASMTLSSASSALPSLVFNDACELCDADLTAADRLRLASIEMSWSYTGIVTQLAPLDLVADRSTSNANDPTKVYGFTQFGGHFIGLQSAVALSKSLHVGFNWMPSSPPFGAKLFELQGGVYDAPLGKTVVQGYSVVIGDSSVYRDHSGLFIFAGQFGTGGILQARDWSLENFQVSGGIDVRGSDNISLIGNLLLKNLIYDRGGDRVGQIVVIDDPTNPKSGNVEVTGNVTSPTNGGWLGTYEALAKIILNGRDDQTVDTVTDGYIGSLYIQKPAASVVHFGSVVSIQGNLVWRSGIVDSSSSALEIGGIHRQHSVKLESGAPLRVKSLRIKASRWSYTGFSGENVKVSGDLTIDHCYFNGDSCSYGGLYGDGTSNLLIDGDVHVNSGYGFDSQNIEFEGTTKRYAFLPVTLSGAGTQNIYGPAVSAEISATPCLSSFIKTCLQGLVSEKPSGSIIFNGSIGISNLMKIPAGVSTDFTNSTLEFVATTGWERITVDIDPSTYLTIRDVLFAGMIDLSNQKYKVGDVTWYSKHSTGGEMSSIQNGTIDLTKNFNVTDGHISENGSGATVFATLNLTLNLVGTGLQELQLPFTTAWDDKSKNGLSIKVEKTSGSVEQVTDLNLYKANSNTNVTIASGVWNTRGHSLSAGALTVKSGSTLNLQGSSISNFGSVSNTGNIVP